MAFASSPADEASYESHGYLLLRDVFDSQEVGALRDAMEETVARVVERAERPDANPEAKFVYGDGRRLQYSSRTAIQWEWAEDSHQPRILEPFDHLHPRFAQLWDDPRLTTPAGEALGVALVGPFTSKLNPKRAREGSEFPWH